MSQNPDQLSKLLLEADGLLLLLHRHRDETPIDAIKLLRRKLELILTLTEGLDEEFDEPAVENTPDTTTNEQNEEPVADYIEDTIESAPVPEPTETEDVPEFQDNTEPVVDEPVKAEPVAEVYEPVNVHISEPVYTPINKPISAPVIEQPEVEENQPEDVVEYNPNYEFVEMTAETVVTDMEPEAPIFIDRDDEPAVVWDDEPDVATVETKTSVEPEQTQPNTQPQTSATVQEAEPIPYRRTYVITDNQFDRNRPSNNTVFQEPAPARRPVSSVFNLNDKFRFRRELFGNSDAQYVECLDLLSAMSSLDEAKDYLYEDLNWDPNNDDVKAFVELLTNYYK